MFVLQCYIVCDQVGGVNTAQDSKYSHSADGFIDFVSARKGGVCSMIRLGLLYVCGREFESPLMVHDKVVCERCAN